jgi:hypothetical protein
MAAHRAPSHWAEPPIDEALDHGDWGRGGPDFVQWGHSLRPSLCGGVGSLFEGRKRPG